MNKAIKFLENGRYVIVCAVIAGVAFAVYMLLPLVSGGVLANGSVVTISEPFSGIKIDADAGRVSIVSGDTARVSFSEHDPRIAVSAAVSGGVLAVTAREPWQNHIGFNIGRFGGAGAINVQVTVPQTVFDSITVSSASADTVIDGGTSNVITVKQLDINTVSGDITVNADAQGGNLGTVSGNVSCGGLLSAVSVNTVSGNINLTQAAGDSYGALSLSTVSGDVNLRCDFAGYGADVSFTTVSGALSGAFDGNVRQAVTVTTVSGDVRLG